MNVGMVLDHEFYGDLRVENEIQALAKAGFNVHLFCFSFKNKSLIIDDYHGAKIFHIPVSKKLIWKLRGLTNTIFNFYPYYLRHILSPLIKKHQIDILHLHDLFLFEVGLLLKKRFENLVLVGDLHENYVEGLKHYKFANTFPGNFLISISKWESKEIEWCNQFDHLITVIDEAVERYQSLGIPQSKFVVVANYVNLETFKIDNIDKSIIEKFDNYKTLMYVGGFDKHRGLDILIKAVPQIVESVKDFRLVLVGTGSNFEELKNLANTLHIKENVIFEGWQPHKLLPSYIAGADICVIPHLKTKHTDNTIPHKLFQYMLLKKPILSSNCNPLVRILDETKSGLTYEFNNQEDLAKKTIELFSSGERIIQMGINGYTAVKKKYNWNETSKNLIELYKKINDCING